MRIVLRHWVNRLEEHPVCIAMCAPLESCSSVEYMAQAELPTPLSPFLRPFS